ncbi:MAG TPA: S8 family serine peptidase [bacterium]|nr:S8 family serine peptidase [bacterium]
MNGLALLLVLSGALPRIGASGWAMPPTSAAAPAIRFANGTSIDIRSAPLPEPSYRLENGTCWLVHLRGPVRQEWLAQLRRLGANPLCYLAYETVVCRLWRDLSASDFKNLPFVDWLGPLPARAKLAPELIPLASASSLLPPPSSIFVLSVWPDIDPNTVAARIVAMGGTVERIINHSVSFRLDAALVPELAALESVAWIQGHSSPCEYNHDVQWVMQIGWRPQPPDELAGRPIWAHGIRGQNMIVGLFDTGINTRHDMFIDTAQTITQPGIYGANRKIAAYKLYDGAAFGDAGSFHGTAVAGTLCGSDYETGDSSAFDGVAPDCRIYFVDEGNALGKDVFDNDFTALLDSVRLSNGMSRPVRQVSGSFGNSDSLSYYRIEESSVDAVCWKDKQFLVIWAAANMGGPYLNIGHPSGAKNALTVGACGNGTNSNTIWTLSSRGPCQDGRIKPDLLAPGESVTTADGHDTHSYVKTNGTSISAPAVSGALMLLRQYLSDGWYPTGTPDSSHRVTRLSSALMRAMAIAGCDSNVGSQYMPNNAAGWGRLDLSNIMHFDDDSNGIAFDDDSVGVSTDSSASFGFDLSGRAPLHVVLAWTDTAAAPLAAISIVNDLDLELTSPDGNHYHGNQFYDGWSAPNPSNWDSLNVEEVCLVSHPLVGHWTARVIGHRVVTARQPFAVAVRGNIAGMVPGISGTPNAELRRSNSRLRTCFGIPLRPGWHLAVFTIDGRKVYDGTHGRSPALRPGVYFYRLTSGSLPPVTGKLVIAR